MKEPTEIAKQAVKDGKLVLIMGVIPRNLGEWHQLADDRSLMIWPVDSKQHRVPTNTGLVLRTQFVNHGITERLKKNLPADTIFYPKPLEPREIKSLLQAVWGDKLEKNGSKPEKIQVANIVPISPAVVAPPAPEVKHPKSPAEILGEFLRDCTSVGVAVDLVLEENANLSLSNNHAQEMIEQLRREKETLINQVAKQTERIGDLVEQLAETEEGAQKTAQELAAALARADAAERRLAEQTLAAEKLLEVFKK